MGFLTSFVKNGEIRPSVSYKIILEQKKKKEINSILERPKQLVICSSAFWKQNCENLQNVSLAFFKFQSVPTDSVSDQRH